MGSLPYELISLDLDMTLLNEEGRISPRNLAAVRRCAEMGAQVVISSGRMHCTTLQFLETMGLDTPVISYNGALIKRESTGEVLLHQTVDLALAHELIELCAERNLHLNYYLDDTLYIAKPGPWADLYAQRTTAALVPVGDLRAVASRPPTKLLIVDTPERVAALFAEWGPRFGHRAYVTTSFIDYLEFMPLGVSKGKALEVLAAHYGIPREKVMAFGDALNDVPAIAWAGLGVAMANAKPEAKAVARRIAPHHAEDGVAAILEETFGFGWP